MGEVDADIVLPALLALCVFLAPVFVLSPLVDFLLKDRQLRAVARRIFRIDVRATLADLPEKSGRRS